MSQTKPNCPIYEATDMVRRQIGKGGDDAWKAAIARVSYATGWSRGKIEAELDREYGAWCAANGYDLP